MQHDARNGVLARNHGTIKACGVCEVKVLYIAEVLPEYASFRYQIAIPAKHFKETHALVGPVPTKDADITVLMKCMTEHEMTVAENVETPIIWSVCDDHFADKYADNYHRMAELADIIVVPCQRMRKTVKAHTGRKSVVIEDPYEFPEKEGFEPVPKSVWFGHKSNLKVLSKETFVGDVEIVTECEPMKEDHITWTPWSIENLQSAFDRANIVLVPQEKPAKSHNRVVEGLRQGKFVVASPIPSYLELSEFIYIGKMKDGIVWACEHPEKAREKIKKGQEYVRERFNPEFIASQWETVFRAIHQGKDLFNGSDILPRECDKKGVSVQSATV